MKKSELIEIIRVAVRVELKESLPKLVKECVKASITSSQKLEVDPVELTKRILKETPKSKSVRTPKKTPTKQFSRNTALNEALNATAGGIPQEGSLVSGGEDTHTITDFNGQSVDTTTLPDHVSNALTRDYSKLLNLVDKKRGGS